MFLLVGLFDREDSWFLKTPQGLFVFDVGSHFFGMGTAGGITGGMGCRFVDGWGVAYIVRLEAFSAWEWGWLDVWDK